MTQIWCAVAGLMKFSHPLSLNTTFQWLWCVCFRLLFSQPFISTIRRESVDRARRRKIYLPCRSEENGKFERPVGREGVVREYCIALEREHKKVETRTTARLVSTTHKETQSQGYSQSQSFVIFLTPPICRLPIFVDRFLLCPFQ